jgi:hypothetical protein
VWRAGDLVVKAADERVAVWSIDPRSGVPELPDLAPGTPAPHCLTTVVQGRTIFTA